MKALGFEEEEEEEHQHGATAYSKPRTLLVLNRQSHQPRYNLTLNPNP